MVMMLVVQQAAGHQEEGWATRWQKKCSFNIFSWKIHHTADNFFAVNIFLWRYSHSSSWYYHVSGKNFKMKSEVMKHFKTGYRQTRYMWLSKWKRHLGQCNVKVKQVSIKSENHETLTKKHLLMVSYWKYQHFKLLYKFQN